MGKGVNNGKHHDEPADLGVHHVGDDPADGPGAQPQLIRGHAHVAHRNAHAQDLLQLKLHLLIYWENRLMGYVAPNICGNICSISYIILRYLKNW